MESLGFQHKHIWGTNGLEAGAGNCSGGRAEAGQQLQDRKTREFPLPWPEQEFGRPEEQFGSETTHGILWRIGLSKIPGCLLRATKKLRRRKKKKKKMWCPGGCSCSPRHSQATGMSWSCCTNTNPASVLTPRDQTLLQHLAWPSGKWGKLGPQTFPVSMQHNPVTRGFSGENTEINTDLNVGSPSGSTGPALCPSDTIPAVQPAGNLPRCPHRWELLTWNVHTGNTSQEEGKVLRAAPGATGLPWELGNNPGNSHPSAPQEEQEQPGFPGINHNKDSPKAVPTFQGTTSLSSRPRSVPGSSRVLGG